METTLTLEVMCLADFQSLEVEQKKLRLLDYKMKLETLRIN
jgi:hypothetical protein